MDVGTDCFICSIPITTILREHFKEIDKESQTIFCDPGLACYLLDIESPKQLSRDKMRGNIFENFVVMEAVKHRMNAGKEGGVFFYRDSNMNEVDVLIKEEGEITALEVKSSMTYKRDFETTLKKLSGWIKTPIRRKTVVYTGDFENYIGDIEIINYKSLTL